MYSIAGHASMLADDARLAAFDRALGAAITPGCTVLDVGTGTGIFALMACRHGAGRVIAVDDSSVVELGRQAAGRHGYGTRIEFIEGDVLELDLPAVDIVVGDVHGRLPQFGGAIAMMATVRDRALRAGGTMIPMVDTVWAAPAQVPDHHARYVGSWSAPVQGFDLGAGLEAAANTVYSLDELPVLLAPPAVIGTVDYRSTTVGNLDSETRWTTGAGTLTGWALWFDSDLGNGVRLRNGPARTGSAYGYALLPVPEATPVDDGAALVLSLEARYVEGHRDYLWRWTTELAASPRWEQSNFRALTVSAESLRRRR